jgi:hypothetical protein
MTPRNRKVSLVSLEGLVRQFVLRCGRYSLSNGIRTVSSNGDPLIVAAMLAIGWTTDPHVWR